MGALLAFALIFVLGNYEFFAAPPPDFLSFRAVAASFVRLELPYSFKRAPAYPAVMALVRLCSPGPDPFLTAAGVVNVVAGLGVLALAYYWTRPRLARWAPLAVALVGTHSQFPLLATLPLCETTYLVLILAAVVSAGRGNGWAYVWAGAAAATRYEALALIPLVALCDAPRWRRRPGLIVYAVLAFLPAAGWLLIGYFRTASLNPYVEEIRALSVSGWAFPRALVASFYEPARPGSWAVSGVMAGVAAVGLIKIAARGDAAARAYLGFAVIYTLIHVVFPFSFRRFVFPLWPLLVLAFLEGGMVLFRGAGKLRFGKWWYAVAAVLFGAFAVGFGWRLAAWRGGLSVGLFLAGLVALGALVVCVAWGITGARLEPRRWALAATAVAAAGVFAGGNFRASAVEREAVKYGRAALKEAALWLKHAAGRDDVIITAEASLFNYYFGPAGPKARPPASFHTPDFALFTARARRAGTAYVCYDSVTGREPEGYFAAAAGAGVLRPLRAGRDVGPYHFIARFEAPREYVYVYRLAARPFVSCGGQPGDDAEFALIAESMGDVPMDENALKIDNLAKAHDGSMATRWTTVGNMEAGFFVEIRFPQRRKVAGLVLNSEPSPFNFPRNFTVEASADGKNWEEVARGGKKATKKGITTINFKEPVEAESIIITINKAVGFRWSIYELEIKYAE